VYACAYTTQCVPLCSVVIIRCVLRTGMFLSPLGRLFSHKEMEAGRTKGMDKYKRWDRNAKEKRINYTSMKGVNDRNVGGGGGEESYVQGFVRGFSLNFRRELLEQVEENAR